MVLNRVRKLTVSNMASKFFANTIFILRNGTKRPQQTIQTHTKREVTIFAKQVFFLNWLFPLDSIPHNSESIF